MFDLQNPQHISQFEHNDAIIYTLDSNLNIIWCNAAWDRFALENGGRETLLRHNQIGRNVVEVTPDPLRPFYAKMYAGALYGRENMSCVYECSSDKILRRFHMHLTRRQTPDGPSLLVINSLILETPHRPADNQYDFQHLREENGFVTMCSHCRRTRIPDGEDRWVWVPDLVRTMPLEVSHGLCSVCFDIHYGS